MNQFVASMRRAFAVLAAFSLLSALTPASSRAQSDAKPADPATLKKLLLQALQAGKAEKSATGVSLLGYSMPVEKFLAAAPHLTAHHRSGRFQTQSPCLFGHLAEC